jgi:hypothetical protein
LAEKVSKAKVPASDAALPAAKRGARAKTNGNGKVAAASPQTTVSVRIEVEVQEGTPSFYAILSK